MWSNLELVVSTMTNYEGMRITIDCVYGGQSGGYRWKVVTDGDVGFYESGFEYTYRKACRRAKRSMKRLAGIGFLSYQKKEIV